MKLSDYFKKFIGNISLNPTREDSIKSAISNWEDKFKSNDLTKDLFIDFYTQGSYANNTAIRPINDNEFDVDVVMVLDIDDAMKPKEALKLIADTIKSYENFKDKVTTKDRCVRIDYANEFHIDIVPAKMTGTDTDIIEIPSKKDDEWKETNPKGYTKWCKKTHSDNNYQFCNIVKMVKHWRDIAVGKETAPKSILLTTILGNNVETTSSISESLVLTLEKLVKNFDDILVNDEPYVENPTLEGENLARDWNKDKFDIFKKKITKLSENARKAYDESDKDKSIELWKEIFGEKFPKQLSESAEMSRDISAKNVLVASSGILNRDNGISIPEHRFFGV